MKERLIVLGLGLALFTAIVTQPVEGMVWDIGPTRTVYTEASYCRPEPGTNALIGSVNLGGRPVPTCTFAAYCNMGSGDVGHLGFLVHCLSASENECPSLEACAAAEYAEEVEHALISAAPRDYTSTRLAAANQRGSPDADWRHSEVSPYPAGFPPAER